MPDEKTFRLRYVGARFAGARLPVNVLSDLPAFRDLLVSFAKDEWKRLHPDRQRVPKGFDASLSFDLTLIEEGSAVPNIVWSRDIAQATLPGFEDEIAQVVDTSFAEVVDLFDSAKTTVARTELTPEKVRALDKFGAALLEGERIEIGQNSFGNVVYLDSERRKRLITSVRETYQSRLSGIGKLASNSVYGHIIIRTDKDQDISVPIDPEEILQDFDGSLDQDVQYDILVEMDRTDAIRRVVEVFDVTVVDASIEAGLMRCTARLAELAALGDGWLDGSGKAINEMAVQAAADFMKRRPSLSAMLRFYPNEDGGVLSELEHAGWDISVEFRIDGSVEMYGVQTDGEGEFDPIDFPSLSDDFFHELDRRVAI